MADETLHATHTCTKCGVEKTAAEFFRDRRRKYTPSGGFKWCKECASNAAKGRRERNPEHLQAMERASYKKHIGENRAARWERNRRHTLKYKFGMTLEDFREKLKAQGYACKICDTELLEAMDGRLRLRTACIDHDHATGKFRALLCNGCNVGLGRFGDSEDHLIRAAEYLRGHRDNSI